MRLAAVLLLASACGRFGFQGGQQPDDARDVDGTGQDARGDGRSSDGPMSDAPVTCPGGVALCDGFEGSFGTRWTHDPMVTLDTTRAHRGASSAHVHSPAFAPNTGSYETLYAPSSIIAGSNIYVRAWFWLSALPAQNNGLELITAERPSSSTGDYMFVENFRTTVYTQLDARSNETTTTVPTGQWFCAVWKVVKDVGTAGSITLQTDIPGINLNLPNAKTDSTTNPVSVVVLGVGFSATNTPSNQPPLDLWIDDVIIDSNPLTCQE